MDALGEGPDDELAGLVLILADDPGFADLGFQGSRDIPTQHLDSLAKTGAGITSWYVSHPFCSPTRAGIMTGRYQHRFGHENNMLFSLDNEVTGLPLTEVTLPSILSEAGYVTGFVGKWHLGSHPRFHPARRGFREMYGFVGGGHDYFDPGSAMGKTIADPVISLDILPTALAAAGIALPQDRRIDGVNLEGRVITPPHSELFWRTFGGAHFAARGDRYKLSSAGIPRNPTIWMVKAFLATVVRGRVSRSSPVSH
ncbi:MAG: sulfatase-like hydrolase/transferase [Bryobacteraceae bacterium]